MSDAAPPLDAPDLAVVYRPGWVDAQTADAWFTALEREVEWRQEHVVLFGRRHAVPRLTAFHGDADRPYAYSGLTMHPRAWTPTLEEIRDRVRNACGTPFNAVLLNLYRDGNDGMGWHADDEPELGRAPTIASVSLGATRTFQLKHRRRKDVARIDVDLTHGSLLVMRPPTQAHWLHGVPKRRKGGQGPRINLTFRWIRSAMPGPDGGHGGARRAPGRSASPPGSRR